MKDEKVRGSIPLYWAQDNSMMAPKPPILMMRMDPFYGSTIRHFQGLFYSPFIINHLDSFFCLFIHFILEFTHNAFQI